MSDITTYEQLRNAIISGETIVATHDGIQTTITDGYDAASDNLTDPSSLFSQMANRSDHPETPPTDVHESLVPHLNGATVLGAFKIGKNTVAPYAYTWFLFLSNGSIASVDLEDGASLAVSDYVDYDGFITLATSDGGDGGDGGEASGSGDPYVTSMLM